MRLQETISESEGVSGGLLGVQICGGDILEARSIPPATYSISTRVQEGTSCVTAHEVTARRAKRGGAVGRVLAPNAQAKGLLRSVFDSPCGARRIKKRNRCASEQGDWGAEPPSRYAKMVHSYKLPHLAVSSIGRLSRRG